MEHKATIQLQYRPEMKPASYEPRNRLGKVLGSGDGTISGMLNELKQWNE